MNPLPVNSINIVQFGFSTLFDLELARLTFDITDLTTFTSGGSSRVQGINFQVIDPSGTEISSLDWPNVAINPATTILFYTLQLSTTAFLFGNYLIKGVIRDADGTDYSIEFVKNICQPRNYSKGKTAAKIEYEADCALPQLVILDRTNMTYATRQPDEVIKNGVVYFPLDTGITSPYNYTPFSIVGSGNVYTGDYVVRHRTDAYYDMGDLVRVKIVYTASLKFTIDCNSSICEILCCVEQMQQMATSECGSDKGRYAAEQLEKVTMPLLLALTMEKCGQRADDLLADIAKTLGCKCSCDSELVEVKPIFTTNQPTVVLGSCAANVTPASNVYTVKVKNVLFRKTDNTDLALEVTRQETNCDISYSIAINKYRLTGDILNQINLNPEYKSMFNTLVAAVGIDLSGIDGKCVIDTTTCDYDLIEDATNQSKLVISVTIDGVAYPAPPLTIINALGIQTWLNSLGKGNWQVYYDTSSLPNTTVFKSVGNGNKVATLTLRQGTVTIIRQFSKSCGILTSILQAMIDYLCGLTEAQIKLSKPYTVCSINAKGEINNEQVAPNDITTLATLVEKMTLAMCSSWQAIKAMQAVDCAAVKKIFIAPDAIKQDSDMLYGTRGGNCGTWSAADLAQYIFTELGSTNNTTLLNLMCTAVSRCVLPTCEPVGYAEVQYMEACPQINAIIGTFN